VFAKRVDSVFMKILLCSAATLAALLVSGCQTNRTAPREIVVSVTSATPVSFSGHFQADGKDQAVSGMTPAEFKIVASRLDCNLRQGPENGTMTIEVRTDTNSEHFALVTASTGPNTDARGEVALNPCFSLNGWF